MVRTILRRFRKAHCRWLRHQETGGYNFRYVYGLDALSVKVTGEGTDWWGQSVKKNVLKNFIHTDVLGSIVTMTDGYGAPTLRTDYDDWKHLFLLAAARAGGGSGGRGTQHPR